MDTLFEAIQVFSTWVVVHSLGVFSSVSCFVLSFWSCYLEDERVLKSLGASVVCVLITLAILSVMRASGLHNSWMPAIGIIVGLIGAVRIRNAVLGAWDNKKNTILNIVDKEQENKK